MIKYIGSKRLLVPTLVAMVRECEGVERVIDLFSGTSRVGSALKQSGYRVWANDYAHYAHTIATCYVQADAARWEAPAQRLLDELSRLPPAAGWFTAQFCERARYVHPDNGARVDAIREHIATLDLEPELEAIALVALMEAADRVDSTTGVQMAYLKQWAKRAHKQLELRLPKLSSGTGRATRGDALDLARSGALEADLIYLDPPYNQHAYLGNYHVWESLVLWDKPELYGVANKRIDCKTRKSPFNSKRKIHAAMAEIIAHARAKWILVSFNNEGYISREEMVALLATRGEVEVVERPFERYVGAKIGIYSPAGEKVGRVSHTKNKEFVFKVRLAQ